MAKELEIPVKKVSSLKPYKDNRIYGIGTVNAQRKLKHQHQFLSKGMNSGRITEEGELSS